MTPCTSFSDYFGFTAMQRMCVISKPLALVRLCTLFCPATGGSALRNSGPIRGLASGQLAPGSSQLANQGAGSWVRWLKLIEAHSVLRRMKTKANEAVVCPCQLPQPLKVSVPLGWEREKQCSCCWSNKWVRLWQRSGGIKAMWAAQFGSVCILWWHFFEKKV